jgi:hypothetical protein
VAFDRSPGSFQFVPLWEAPQPASGVRGFMVRLLVFSALALVPAKTDPLQIVADRPHPIVQPFRGPIRGIDEMVASVASHS